MIVLEKSLSTYTLYLLNGDKNSADMKDLFYLLTTGAALATTRVVTRGQGGRNSPGAESLRGAPKGPNSVTSTLFNSSFASERSRVRKWGRQTCFLPRAPFNLVTPLQRHHLQKLPEKFSKFIKPVKLLRRCRCYVYICEYEPSWWKVNIQRQAKKLVV